MIEKLHSYFLACLFTEWFDLDDPCKQGDVESVYVSNIYVSKLGKQVSFYTLSLQCHTKY